MKLALSLALASASLILLLSFVIISYLMLFRRCIGPCLGRRPRDDEERCSPAASSRVADEPALKSGSPAIRRFGWGEIESLTGAFTAPVIGEGGFSTVYLGRLPDSTVAAVKVQRSSERLHRVFLRELDVLLHVRHPNIVRLHGYSDDREEGVLLFEYVPNGTLHDRLHGDGDGGVLPWDRRMRIAFQIAAAVDYLHDGCDLQIVHGDITASNVLLDGRLDPKLCDFGCALMGFSAAVQPRSAGPMIGSPGYADPHYLRTGIVSKKSDVYSFGVLVLELITGTPAFRSDDEKLLTAEIAPVLAGNAGVPVDPRLGTNFDAGEAAAMAAVAARCVGDRTGLRPSMAEILKIMRESVASSISAVGSKSDGRSAA